MDGSPFSLLPEELVNKIFLDCLSDRPSLKSIDAPLVLTHVCHAWRSISLDTPQLWSHIVVPQWQECPARIIELVKLWLSRARSVPLSVDIALFNQDGRTLSSPEDSENLDCLIQDILCLLTPHRSRVQMLWGIFPAAFIRDVGVEDMVNVERLFFYGTSTDYELLRLPDSLGNDSELPSLVLGPCKEKLKVLSVSDCVVDINSIMSQTRLTHLELLDIHRSSAICQETALKLLQNLPDLQKCVLELYRAERPDWNGQGSRTVLTNLEVLCFIWKFPADISLLLDSLSTPNLIRLGLRGTPTAGPRSWSSLHDFLRASQAPLLRLCLGNVEEIGVQLLDCLRCCPLIRHLSFDHSRLPEELFPALTFAREREGCHAELLPRLETLSLVACGGLRSAKVAEFLKSRASDVPPGTVPLRDVEIISCCGITEDDVPLLQQCGVEHLRLRISGDYLQ